jgi:hypothetical protein
MSAMGGEAVVRAENQAEFVEIAVALIEVPR